MIVGHLTSVYGVKGWVKVFSHTQPRENIFQYSPWWVKTAAGWAKLNIDQHRATGKDLLVHIEGVDDRDEARLHCKQDIYIEKAEMPPLPANQFYWHQLEGLAVNHVDGRQLGVVSEMMETGANDVLVVAGSSGSIDQRERLLPYVDQVVLKVDLEAGVVEVDWDPEF